MPDIVVRTALPADITRCSELLGTLFSLEREFLPDPKAQKRGIELIVNNPDIGRVFVCTVDGSIQGMVLLLFTVSTFLGRKVALLEDMIVDQGFRGEGLGTMLINHAVTFAERQGFGRITLLTDHDNSRAQEFYSRSGFLRSSMIAMRKSL
ncbi:MAG: GNAT family N-acetyltransferase [Chlorobium sp.]|jgi:GNAT superfamily N-acetyltransferase|uniref:GNAT family N-acetyltransferase n=1 Tax=Chlorobium sp. TaxID=1095 RepID=UPI001DC888B4|nr:GNAT family N-acetyltransferase [Chlorobium sp.]MBN1279822.1 GNAT family N-acetyltransferase [Chlorobiaceae bacterium]MCF8216797.1 GNAT family N-acetyltransferase [Chlorobium sp.]MCF8271548.1 GNAT family N-acetyltransferase [Chlorobium sp.]MCF8287920.1 GNAT family N-acetyltransferase [Chlorobium sp.]MCF8291598.1 GNAT family N-acetyltransferase [Chlorobium sp.]